jgi:myo-inositol-1(or 4)-monophosphatase
MLIDHVKELFPDHAVHGEESGYVGNENAEYVWYCDPIDGTKAFAMSVPLITCILALAYKGEPVIGVIYDPILDRIVVAQKGKGVLFNNTECFNSPHSEIKKSYIAFSVNIKYNWVNMFDVWMTLHKQHVQFSYIHIGMAGLLLASGNIDAIVLPFFSDYEFLALKVIFDEGGFVTTNLHGQPITDIHTPKQGLVVAKPKLHAELLEAIAPHTAGLTL